MQKQLKYQTWPTPSNFCECPSSNLSVKPHNFRAKCNRLATILFLMKRQTPHKDGARRSSKQASESDVYRSLSFGFFWSLIILIRWLGAFASWNGGWFPCFPWFPWFPICSSQLLEHVSDSSALLELISAKKNRCSSAECHGRHGQDMIHASAPVLDALSSLTCQLLDMWSDMWLVHVFDVFLVRVVGAHIMSC